MENLAEVRFKLSQKVHLRWSECAEARGLTLRAFIIALVSEHLVQTKELFAPSDVTEVIPEKPKAVSPELLPDPYAPKFEPDDSNGIVRAPRPAVPRMPTPPIPKDVVDLVDSWDDEDA